MSNDNQGNQGNQGPNGAQVMALTAAVASLTSQMALLNQRLEEGLKVKADINGNTLNTKAIT